MNVGKAIAAQSFDANAGGARETREPSSAAGAAAQGFASGGATRAPVESTERILGAMVHAISNSLNSIMTTSQLANLLITQHRLGEARVSLDRVEEECTRAARLLRDGRNLMTLKVPAVAGGVDAAALLFTCAQACSGVGDVDVECEAGLPPVRGQADALKRMFVEILDNAFEFGARRVAVSATADHAQGVLRIEFRDDGPGVQTRSPALFEAFVTSDPVEHSGLGLAYAAQIATAYEGAIGLGESAGGTLIWVRLPFAVH